MVDQNHDLYALGWKEEYSSHFTEKDAENDIIPARIILHNKSDYITASEKGEYNAKLRGSFLKKSPSIPVVGDWVKLHIPPGSKTCIIEEMLPRKTELARASSGEKLEKQVLAANIDYVLVVTDHGQDYNPARLERYMTLIWQSGATPVVVLNKADLASEHESYVKRTTASCPDVNIITASAETSEGIEKIRSLCDNGNTIAFVGSSGVGKTSILNSLFGEKRLATREISKKTKKGKHTTSGSRLFFIEGGSIIDSPGLREIALWGKSGIESSFPDIEELTSKCKFSDCKHGTEPGCAVKEALNDGSLMRERYESYLKQKKEIAFTEDRKKALDDKEAWAKDISKLRKKMGKSSVHKLWKDHRI
ncbi:ribosome small subunit-dependent GTPase A [Spirochaetota bacterium]